MSTNLFVLRGFHLKNTCVIEENQLQIRSRCVIISEM